MPLIKTSEIDFYYLTTKRELEECVKILESKDILYCDTETYPLYNLYGSQANWRDPHTSKVRNFQVNFKGNFTPYVIDIMQIGVDNCQSLVNLLLNESVRKVFHNAKFDISMLRATLGIWAKNVWCTLVCAQRLNVCTGFRAGQMRGNSLKALARDYLGINLDKTEQTSDWSNPNLSIEQLSYAALDVGAPKSSGLDSIVGYLYNLFIETLYTPSPKGFGGYCKLKDYKEPIEVDQAANAILAEIEYTGMPVSVKMLDLIYNTANRELEDLKLYLCKSFNLPLQQTIEYTENGPQLKIILSEETQKTLNNPKKLVQLVNNTLRKQSIELTDVMSGSLEEALKRLKAKESEEEEETEDEEYYWEDTLEWNIELIDKLLKYKELVKLTGTDYRKLINPITGRLHSSYQCIGASTGRMSSGGKGSFNCQQISKTNLIIKYLLSLDIYNTGNVIEEDKEVSQVVNMRYAFVTDTEGMLHSSCDFDSQEAKNVAAICNDPELKKAYLLLKNYADKVLELPKHPETGEPYTDPNTDIHILAAASISPEVNKLVEEEPWNANKDNPIVAFWRQLGKILNYALIYLAQAMTIAAQIGKSKEEAQDAIDKYFIRFHILKQWLDSVATIATELRWIRTITGDLVFINETNSKGLGDSNTAARKAVNHCICFSNYYFYLLSSRKKREKYNVLYMDTLMSNH